MRKLLINICCLLFFAGGQFTVSGQSDRDYLLNEGSKLTLEFKEVKTKRTFVQKINPIYWIYTGMADFYKKNISVQIAANCVFEETCSHYSRKLVSEKGVFAGVVLSLDRLSRCNKVTLAETSPLRLTRKGKVIENIDEYSF
jgi:putative component of membrane protein insertase Oxa1/YidC/SpoIIIJ protein YidD